MGREQTAGLIFVSYSHDDRPRVERLVNRFKRRWNVWWDRENEIGAAWRGLIVDRLTHADCVVVVWTRRSVKSRWVLDEAEEGANRGVLMPVLLDHVQPPIGLRQYQHADLIGWQGERRQDLTKLVKGIGKLLEEGLRVNNWPTLESGREISRSGVQEARSFVSRVRTQASMFKKNPAATAALSEALTGVANTFAAVNKAVDDFLTPVMTGSVPTAAKYRTFATGSLVAEIESKRGHCTHLAQAYIEEGGLRDGLPPTTDPKVRDELDSMFRDLSSADQDLFEAMIAVGDSLAIESASIVNMLVAGQKDAARVRLDQTERRLRPLVRDLNRGKQQLNRATGELGIVLGA